MLADVYCAAVGVQTIAINLSVCVCVCVCRCHCVSVCMCVCLSASISLELLDRSSQKFVYSSPVAVARSSSGSVVIRNVLPVLWMTSRVALVGRMPIGALRYRGGV